jgi:hypothetical protein
VSKMLFQIKHTTMDSVQKAKFLLLFYWVPYAYILRGLPVIATDTQTAVKGICASNTSTIPYLTLFSLFITNFVHCCILHLLMHCVLKPTCWRDKELT